MMTYDSCLTTESVPLDKSMLRAEIDLWRQKWRRTQAANEAIPSTAIDGLLACDQQTFPIIRSLLTILLSLPVSTAGVERSCSTLRRLKTWTRSRMCETRLTALALLNVHRAIPVSPQSVIEKFARNKKRHYLNPFAFPRSLCSYSIVADFYRTLHHFSLIIVDLFLFAFIR